MFSIPNAACTSTVFSSVGAAGAGRVQRIPGCFFLCVALVSITACGYLGGSGLAEDYKRPDAPAKQAWSTPLSESPPELVQQDWWRGFKDPYLNGLIDQALLNNTDLKVLVARVDASEAELGLEQAQGQPRLGTTASKSLQKFSGQDVTRSYELQGQANWEIDLWGKLREGVRAQEAAVQASEAEWRAGYLSLVSDVAQTYFRIRQLDEQHQRQQQALDKNEEILTLYRNQMRAGIVSQVDVWRQEAEVRRLSEQLIDLARERELSENRLATLLGTPAGDLEVATGRLTEAVALPEVPAGLPSDLLTRRPDILAAEYRVLQAHHLVGKAKLARLPSFSLTGSAGSSSNILADLTRFWTLGLTPSINIPIFDPTIARQLKVNEAQGKVAEEEYRRTVLNAFEEVENALTNLAHQKQQKAEIEQQINHLQQVHEQVRAQIREGLISQLDVFESERSLLSAQQTLLDLHQSILSNTVRLYKAMGGGWPETSVGAEVGVSGVPHAN